jgi:hypothetical protein
MMPAVRHASARKYDLCGLAALEATEERFRGWTG